MTTPIIDNQTAPEAQPAEKAIEEMSLEELEALEKSTLEAPEQAEPAPAPVEDKPAKPEDPPPLEKIVADQKSFIGRQTTEIGELRKMVSQLQQQMQQMQKPKEVPPPDPEAEKEEFFKNPIEKLTKKIEDTLEERETKRKAEEQADLETRRATRETVIEAVPDFDDVVQDVFAVLLADGFPEETVIEFAKNPWKERPEALVALAKRARAERKLREFEAGKQPPPAQEAKPKPTAPKNPITSTVGSTRTTNSYLNGLTDSDIARMSDEELNAILKKAKTGG